jgi:hypothetical protein
MSTALELLLVLTLCGILSLVSFRLGLLDASGSLASFGMGVIIGAFGSINWLIMLIAFALAGFIVTRYKFELKASRGVQEGAKGERNYLNVVANGLVPAAIAVISFALGEKGTPLASLVYLCAIAEAASDTIASELGVLSPRVWLITTFRPVPPGTNGHTNPDGLPGMQHRQPDRGHLGARGPHLEVREQHDLHGSCGGARLCAPLSPHLRGLVSAFEKRLYTCVHFGGHKNGLTAIAAGIRLVSSDPRS